MTSAAQNNLDYAQNLQSAGFSPYTGQQVADFAPQQQQSFGMGSNVANAATSNAAAGGSALSDYLGGAQYEPTVNAESISSQMSPYMSQYVNMSLQPQLQEAANTYQQQSQAQQGAATSAGAFGDPRANLLQSNLGLNYATENAGLVGNAYNSAFNTAIGAGAQDVANNLNAQTTNAGLYNTQLANLLAGSNTAYAQGTGGTNLENTLGAQQTAQSQAGLNAEYNQWLMAQQYPFQTTQLMDSALGAAQAGAPTTTTSSGTQSAPNNSGYGLLGSLLGASGSALSGGGLSALLGGGSSGAAGGGGAAALAMLEKGGPIGKKQPAIVGEKGPEIFVPHESGTVIPYDRIKRALAHAEKTKGSTGIKADALARALGIPGYAAGGSPAVGVPSLVGEQGPELFVPNNAAYGFGPPPGAQAQNGGTAPGGGLPPQFLQFLQQRMQQNGGQPAASQTSAMPQPPVAGPAPMAPAGVAGPAPVVPPGAAGALPTATQAPAQAPAPQPTATAAGIAAAAPAGAPAPIVPPVAAGALNPATTAPMPQNSAPMPATATANPAATAPAGWAPGQAAGWATQNNPASSAPMTAPTFGLAA